MSKSILYICIICGSKHGEPTKNGNENWFWQCYGFGRIGPFCSREHTAIMADRLDNAPRFTLEEWERLRFYRECARSEYAERIFS